MPRTSTEVQRRAAKRKALLERQRAADEEENKRKALEVEIGADFEVALDDHASALAAAAAAEVAMGEAIVQLFALGIPPARIATLTGQPESEIKRLRKLATEQQPDGSGASAGPASRISSDLRAESAAGPARSSANRNTQSATTGFAAPGEVAAGNESPNLTAALAGSSSAAAMDSQ